MTYFIESGPENAIYRMIIAHGAGAGISSPFLEAIAALLNDRGLAVTRFEFDQHGAGPRRRQNVRRREPKAHRRICEHDRYRIGAQTR